MGVAGVKATLTHITPPEQRQASDWMRRRYPFCRFQGNALRTRAGFKGSLDTGLDLDLMASPGAHSRRSVTAETASAFRIAPRGLGKMYR